MLKKFVLDTSVIVKWFSDEAGSIKAKGLLKDLEKGKIEIIIPELVKYELANALLKGKSLSYLQTSTALEIFYSLPLIFVAEDSKLSKESCRLAGKFGITYYDACFLALAKQKKACLATSNPKHQKKVKGLKIISI